MNQRPTIREQIDACRPDGDDLHLPEHAADLAELQASLREGGDIRNQWEQSQAEGRVIRAAMHDVSLPAGLEARLLAAVQAAVPTLSGIEQAAKENVPSDETTVTPATVSPAKMSRRWLLISGPIAVAALVLGGVFAIQNLRKTDQPISRDELASQVESWLLKLDLRTMTKLATPPALPTGVVGTASHTSVIASRQGNITAYSLKGGAFLLVVPTTSNYPVPGLPYMKLSGISGGWQVGVWQSAGVLYVIAIPNEGHLSDFVRQPQVG